MTGYVLELVVIPKSTETTGRDSLCPYQDRPTDSGSVVTMLLDCALRLVGKVRDVDVERGLPRLLDRLSYMYTALVVPSCATRSCGGAKSLMLTISSSGYRGYWGVYSIPWIGYLTAFADSLNTSPTRAYSRYGAPTRGRQCLSALRIQSSYSHCVGHGDRKRSLLQEIYSLW